MLFASLILVITAPPERRFPASAPRGFNPLIDMNGLFFFEIDADHFATQLRLDEDRSALADLGRRCVEYLRSATGQRIDLQDAPRFFQALLRPVILAKGPSFVLGIYAGPGAQPRPPRLVGALCFVRPILCSDMWYLPLLVLEPAARGKGLGTAVHRAFVDWAASRGATRVSLSFLSNNPRAWHFWRDRIGYQDAVTLGPRTGRAAPSHRELQFRLTTARTPAPWCVHRPAHHPGSSFFPPSLG